MNRKYIAFNMGSHRTVEVYCISASSDTMKIIRKLLLLSLSPWFSWVQSVYQKTKIFLELKVNLL